MTLFLIFAGLLTAVALAVLIPPLLKPVPRSEQVIRERLRTLPRELRALRKQLDKGEIDESTWRKLRNELAQDILDGVEPEDGVAETPKGRWAALLTAIVIPAIAIGLYSFLGQPQLIDGASSPSASAESASGHGPNAPPVDKMIAGLEEKLKADPDNVEGWFMLGRSYMLLKKYPKAVKALKKAHELKNDDPDIMMRYADALAMLHGGQISGEPAKLIRKALEINPNHPEALWLAGIASQESGQLGKAIEFWQRAKQNLPGDQESQQLLDQAIAKAKAELGGEGEENQAQASPAPQPVKTASAAGGESPAIQVKVALSPELVAKARPDDMVFIYAKAASGPPMPLAAQKRRVKDLPVTVTLSDDQAMMPALKLSRFDSVVVGARVSRSGNPIGAPGDLEGTTEPLAPKTTPEVTVTIDKVRP
ncbi:MAG TPA: c-type cytochrome biogenesis protein CcmI [Gammaproteobacteria bacterium]|nr:c-type cytochrome biogenesis protein CcmI [Gammaproteobacteria bacterium]